MTGFDNPRPRRAKTGGRRGASHDGAFQDGPDPGSSVAEDAEPDPVSVAQNIVYRQLTASAKSRLQLARKLAERNIPEDVAEAVLDRFQEARLINDADFADMWVRSRSQSRKLAKGALRRELAEKGIDQETAAAALDQLTDADEEAAARQLVERKLRPGTDLQDRAARDKATRRLASMLARKGYQPSQAFRIVNEVLDSCAGADGANP
ncbi:MULTISPECIES: regulatory protein RecX [Pseudarthrobacter]|uniref:Regulatory protein RecX n=1 Tax=Pseudarthrobacter polychromogenes TaxID=1676 RepID=A0ABQ1XEZ4_9MICC|nr:regulatory protein RecX [Pseudarthrobacter polychromogenes]